MNFIKKAWMTFRHLKTWIQIVIVLVLLSLLGAIGGSGSENSSQNSKSTVSENSASQSPSSEPTSTSPSPSSEPTVENKPWFPKGFQEFQEGIAFKWSNGSCDYGRCNHAIFISRDGCPRSLYVEVNGFDSSKIQVDYTNDTTSSLAPMRQAKLEFNFTQDSVRTAYVSKVNCY
jgi:hypothetical protein